MKIDLKKQGSVLWKNRYILLVLLLGLALILLPDSDRSGKEAVGESSLEATGAALNVEAEKLERLLGDMAGVGRVRVLLSRAGAVVLCDGADSSGVRLNVTRAVSAYTGLGSDKISVVRMK